MAWRNARSLDVLRDEIEQVASGTTFWTIGDEDHQDEWSDHNPNECCDVVCAADILDDAGLDLTWFVGRVTATDPPALKYVIYRDRIWFPGLGWQVYRGAWHSHVHVSVGVGPDGRSTGPYDDTSSWGLEEDEMPTVAEVREAAKWGWYDALRGAVHDVGGDTWQRRGHRAIRNNFWALVRPVVAAELAEVEGQVAGLTELVRQALVVGPGPVTDERWEQMIAAVRAGATEGAQAGSARVEAMMAAGAQAELDVLAEPGEPG